MKRLVLPTVLTSALFLSAGALGENTPASRLSLKGLQGVALRVDPIDPAAGKDGLTVAAIRSAVQARLRKAQIPVLTAQQQREQLRRPCLVVQVATSKLSTGEYLYAVRVEMSQWVASLANPAVTVSQAIPVPAATWSARSVFGIVPAEHLRRDAQGAVDRMADEFINAYHQANPSETAFRFYGGTSSK
jgi:hypothetical protein